jgi:hypothetical protein
MAGVKLLAGIAALAACAIAWLSSPAAPVDARAPGREPVAPFDARAGERGGTFPRLLGMNIGAKNYEDPRYQRELARLDVVVLGFYRGWAPAGYARNSPEAMRKAVAALKALNPRLLVGQYSVLNETYDDPKDVATADLRGKLTESGWWLKDAAGRKVQWTAQFNAWVVNYTNWARPDGAGLRWPQWLALRDHAAYFRDVPELDIVFFDNVFARPRVRADWDGDGRDDDESDPRILAAHYAAHLAHWQAVRTTNPRAILVGNVADADLSNAEWRGQLEGGFLEGIMGLKWSIETREGWPAMMKFYRTVMSNLKEPKIAAFNVHGNPSDYRLFRYAYASCLLDDGYFSFTDVGREYSSVPWFDEYDFRLGRSVSRPPVAPWRDGVWRRDFENGLVLVNPTRESRTVTLEPGYRRLAGNQDPKVNDGSAVTELVLRPKHGIVLRRSRGDQ